MISIIMDSNERGTGRADALQAYLMDHPKEYDFSWGDVEVDLVFSIDGGSDIVIRRDYPGLPCIAESVIMPRKCRAVELKMSADFVASLQPDPQTGRCHLDDQRRQCPYPLQVAVLGSVGDVMRALPEVTGNGWRNPGERAQAEGMIRRGIASLKASGVDVSFGLSTFDFLFGGDPYQGRWAEAALKDNMAQVVREATAYLRGDIHLPRAKCESVKEAMLMTLPGVGPERARAMLDEFIIPCLRYRGIADLEEKMLTSIPGIGKKTAERILEAIR